VNSSFCYILENIFKLHGMWFECSGAIELVAPIQLPLSRGPTPVLACASPRRGLKKWDAHSEASPRSDGMGGELTGTESTVVSVFRTHQSLPSPAETRN
jgi:hypothetical protein